MTMSGDISSIARITSQTNPTFERRAGFKTQFKMAYDKYILTIFECYQLIHFKLFVFVYQFLIKLSNY